MSSNFDRPIKNYPIMRNLNEGTEGVRRFLTLSSASTGSGVKSARPNVYGKQ